jgi:hypothetical protein
MMMGDQVECRSDFEYAQRPIAFYWQGQRLEVAEVLSQIRLPHGYSFRVRNPEHGIFELNYDIRSDQWSVNQL